MKEKFNNILIIGDSPNQTTGYGGQLKYIAQYLNKEWDVCFLGLQSVGLPIWYMGDTTELPLEKPYRLYPRAKDRLGIDAIPRLLKKLKPKAVLTLCDIGLQNAYAIAFEACRVDPAINWKGKWIAYTPYDCYWFNEEFKRGMEVADVYVAISKFAEKYFIENKPPLSKRKQYGKTEELKIVRIPHGVDTNIFKPDKKIREKMRFENRMNNKFVCGAFGRNQVRKMWQQTIRSFALFAKDKEDVCLLLHTEPTHLDGDPDKGWNIPELVKKHNLDDKMRMTVNNLDVMLRYSITPKMMNAYYNILDVYFFMTGGEGWGCPTVEAMAAGVVPVLPNHSTGPELCGYLEDNYEPHGLLVKQRAVWEASNGIEWCIADEKDGAEKLQYLYDNPDELKKRSKKARDFVVEHYDWKVVGPMWIKLFKEVIE